MSQSSSLRGSGTTAPPKDYGSTARTSNDGTGSSSALIGSDGSVDIAEANFNSLCEAVGKAVQHIKSAWSSIEKTLKIIGTPNDSKDCRQNINDLQRATNERITQATQDLARLTSMARASRIKQHRLQADKLTTDFHMIVRKYTLSQKDIATKMKATYLISDIAVQEDADLGGSGSMDDNKMVQQQRQLQAQQFDLDLQLERENQVRVIETLVLDVNNIMSSLQTQISQQGEIIDTIESNVEFVQGNVEAGSVQLDRAAASQNKYRKKVLILVLIAFILGLIVTIVVVKNVTN